MAMATGSLRFPSLPGTAVEVGLDRPAAVLRSRLSLVARSFCRNKNLLRAARENGELVARTSMASESVEISLDRPYSSSATAKLVAIVSENSVSPLRGATWREVMEHMARRIRWVDEGFEMVVFTDKSARASQEFQLAISEAQILVVVGVRDSATIMWLLKHAESVDTKVCFDSSQDSETWLGGVKVIPLNPVDKLSSRIPGSGLNKGLKVLDLVTNAWSRRSSDNICFALLVLIDSYVTPVRLLKNLRATNLASIQCMSRNCGKQILACLLDENCRKALNCLNSCPPNDQVCSYRCIVSYESDALEAFSLCILQKHNCLGLTAEIQMQPNVEPMRSFRGRPLTHSLAEDLFIGWLGGLKWSWRVVAGQNAAYDQFPNQYQIFYRGKSKGSVWYDPVFQVKTLDGKTVWRRRHYRVRRADVPGSFYFSVLDNGVVSKEYWRIVDVTEDLSWGLFYYSGAAEAAGQSYTGAVLVSADGLWPAQSESGRLQQALERCGIKLWEMYNVQNDVYDADSCKDIPLGIPEGSRLHEEISAGV